MSRIEERPRTADPIHVRIELEEQELGEKPRLEVQEIYPEGVPPSTVRNFYEEFLPDECEVEVEQEDGHPVLTATTDEARAPALFIAGRASLGLVERADLDMGELMELWGRMQMHDPEGVY